MSTSGLLDIHVLEETTTRVAGLTNSIAKQVSVVESLSANAQKALGPTSTHTQSLGTFRDNITSILQIYEHIEGPTRRIQALEEPIDQGVQAVGWQNYADTVIQAQNLQRELSMQPELQRFPQLSDAISKVYNRGQENLEKYMRRLCKAVFTPVNGSKYVSGSESIPEVPQEDLVTLSKLESSLRRFPVAQKRADESLNQIVEEYILNSLQPAAKAIAPGAGKQEGQRYLSLCEDLKTVLLNALQTFYSENPAKLKSSQELVEKLVQREINKATLRMPSEKATQLDSSRADTYNPKTPTFQNPYKEEFGNSSATLSNSPYRGNSPFVSNSTHQANSPNQSLQTPKPNGNDGRSAPFSSITSPAPSSARSGSVGTPCAEGRSTSVSSFQNPGIMSPMRSGSGPVGGSQSSNWEVFLAIDQSRSSRAPPEEIAKYKRDGLTTLIQLFINIERQCKTAPITSEFGASPASFLFMPILEHLTQGQRGVEVVLSEIATRAYLAKPFPAWAIKSEPSPAARADPVSLFFSDCLDCQYANLLYVATEQLKSTSRIGVFMLSNMAAIEHYICSERNVTNGDATLNSVEAPTEIMKAMGNIALKRFAKLMDDSFKMYMTDWRKLAPYLMETTMTGSGSGGTKLAAKDRDAVKEKFRVFNTEFESLLERHSKIQIKDATLRARMSNEVKKLIGPLYTRFYMKHKDGDFTKNVGKYVKYTPEQFENAIRL